MTEPSPSAEGGEISISDAATNVLAERIAARREALGLSRAELAKAAGVHYLTINRIEGGKNSVTVSLLVRIASALGTSAAELLVDL